MFGKKEKNILKQPKIYSPPKEQRPFVFPRYLKVIIAILISIIAVVYLLFFSTIFKINNFDIIGNVSEDSNKNIENARGQNIFIYNSKELEDRLKKDNPQFLNIKVSKGIPNLLRIKIEERSPQIIWKTNDKVFLVDEEGIAFKEIPSEENYTLAQVTDNKNIAITIPSQVATSNFIIFIKDLLNKVNNDQSYSVRIDSFQINETIFQVDAITDKGFKMIFDITRPLSDQLDAFLKVYKDHKDDIKEYIDLRVEGWVYYKCKNGS